MLPALPAPSVATEIVPPSPIVNVGVVTVISPALPVFDAVLNSPAAIAGDRHGIGRRHCHTPTLTRTIGIAHYLSPSRLNSICLPSG